MGMDDGIAKILWTKRFLEAQGYPQKNLIVNRDNTSSLKLETNGRASASKRTRHFDIKYFYVTDLVTRKEIDLRYCPTDKMLADYFTKPLVGRQFEILRSLVMNLEDLTLVQQECVG